MRVACVCVRARAPARLQRQSSDILCLQLLANQNRRSERGRDNVFVCVCVREGEWKGTTIGDCVCMCVWAPIRKTELWTFFFFKRWERREGDEQKSIRGRLRLASSRDSTRLDSTKTRLPFLPCLQSKCALFARVFFKRNFLYSNIIIYNLFNSSTNGQKGWLVAISQ